MDHGGKEGEQDQEETGSKGWWEGEIEGGEQEKWRPVGRKPKRRFSPEPARLMGFGSVSAARCSGWGGCWAD